MYFIIPTQDIAELSDLKESHMEDLVCDAVVSRCVCYDGKLTHSEVYDAIYEYFSEVQYPETIPDEKFQRFARGACLLYDSIMKYVPPEHVASAYYHKWQNDCVWLFVETC